MVMYTARKKVTNLILQNHKSNNLQLQVYFEWKVEAWVQNLRLVVGINTKTIKRNRANEFLTIQI